MKSNIIVKIVVFLIISVLSTGLMSGCEFIANTLGLDFDNEDDPLASPGNFVVTVSDDNLSLDLSWEAVSGADTYAIYRSEGTPDNFVWIGSVTADFTATFNSTTSPTDYPAAPGVFYYYQVVAVDQDNNAGDFSEIVEAMLPAPLDAPLNLTASTGDYADRIDLDWDPVTGAADYVIYRATVADGTYTPIGAVDADYTATWNSTESPVDYTITRGAHYFYKVAARDVSGMVGEMGAYAEGWTLLSIEWEEDGDGAYRYYTVDPADKGQLPYTWFSSTDVDDNDATIEIDIRKMSGVTDTYAGMIFDYESPTDYKFFVISYYGLFGIWSYTGSWSNWYGAEDEWWHSTAAVNTAAGATHTLKITTLYGVDTGGARRTNLTTYINDVQITTGNLGGWVDFGAAGMGLGVDSDEDFQSGYVDFRFSMNQPVVLP